MKILRFAALILAVVALAGCLTPTDVQVKKAMAGIGYIYVNPPEVGINPGEIYSVKAGNLNSLSPSQVTALSGIRPVAMPTTNSSNMVSYNLGAAATLASTTVSSSPKLSALLTGSNVKTITVDFGTTIIEQIPTDNLQESTFTDTLPAGYQASLKNVIAGVKSGNRTRNVIVAVFESEGMKITVSTSGSETANAIANVVNTSSATISGSATIMGSGSNTVVLQPSDSTKDFVIGVKYLNKDDLWPTQ